MVPISCLFPSGNENLWSTQFISSMFSGRIFNWSIVKSSGKILWWVLLKQNRKINSLNLPDNWFLFNHHLDFQFLTPEDILKFKVTCAIKKDTKQITFERAVLETFTEIPAKCTLATVSCTSIWNLLSCLFFPFQHCLRVMVSGAEKPLQNIEYPYLTSDQ